jgi:hypothetical protein
MTSPEQNGLPSGATYTFPCVPAAFEPHALERYRGNPLIEALRFPKGTAALRRALTFVPDFNDEMRQLDRPTRRLLLQEFKRFRVATPRMCELAELVHGGMLESLVDRVPHTPQANRRLGELYRHSTQNTLPSLPKNGAEFAGAMIGKGGCGKTFALDAVAGIYETTPVIHHCDLGIWQIPVVKLAMPFLGSSRKTLATAIIDELDKQFPDGNYRRLYLNTRANSNQLLLIAFRLLQLHCVGYVLIDDSGIPATLDDSAARRKEAAEAKTTPLATLLIAMSNQSRVPVLFAGTPELKQMLGTTYSLLRRSTGSPWGPLDIEARGKSTSEFDQVLDILWTLQLLRQPIALTDGMRRLFHLYTFGIPDTLVKLFTSVQRRALFDGEETITEELVHHVATTELHDIVEVAVAHQELKRVGAAEHLLRMGDLRAELQGNRGTPGEFGRPRQPVWSLEQALERFLPGDDDSDIDREPDAQELQSAAECSPSDIHQAPGESACAPTEPDGQPQASKARAGAARATTRRRKSERSPISGEPSEPALHETTWEQVGK